MALSVIVPVHNGARFLDDALDGLLAQLPPGSEVIVVDDGSTDETPKLLKRYAGRVQVVTRERPSGAGTARNVGVAHSHGDILAFHDADDLVLPGRFAEPLRVLDAHRDVDLAFGNGIKIDERGQPLGPLIPARHARRLRKRVGLHELLGESFIFTQALCVRRSRFLELGGFRRELAEDWDFALRASLGSRIVFVDQPLFAYRRHPEAVTEKQARFASEMVAMLETFLEDFPEARQRVGARHAARCVAKRLERSARHLRRSGQLAAARAALDRAIRLSPGSLRYRWRRLTLAAT